MLRHVPSVLFSAAAALALASSTAAQDYYTTFGTGCPGPSGIPPAIGITGLPIAGQQFAIDVTAAPSNAPAVLLFGVSDQFWNGQPLPFHLGVIGSPGCWLLVSNDITLTTLTDPAGSAQLPIPLPPPPALLGVTFHNQWVVLAGNRLVVSDGGHGTISDHPPLSVASVSPAGGPVGTPVTVRVLNGNFGNDPDNLCMLVMDPRGDTSLLRPTSVSFDAVTGEDVITATLLSATELQPPLPSSVGVMRGVGGQPMLAPSASLDVSSTWGWQGSGLPGSGAAGGTFTPQPTPTVAVTGFVPGTLGFSTRLPDDPFGNGGIYPSGRHIHIEIHWQRRNGKWVDIVIDIDLRLAAPGPVVAAELGPMLQSAIDQTIGHGVLVVSSQGLELSVSPATPDEAVLSVAGHVILP